MTDKSQGFYLRGIDTISSLRVLPFPFSSSDSTFHLSYLSHIWYWLPFSISSPLLSALSPSLSFSPSHLFFLLLPLSSVTGQSTQIHQTILTTRERGLFKLSVYSLLKGVVNITKCCLIVSITCNLIS